MSSNELKVQHTPTPWIRSADVYIDSTATPPRQICIVNSGLQGSRQEVDIVNTRFITAACNSYGKHCGQRAVECAERDLLGELLEVLKNCLERFWDAMNAAGVSRELFEATAQVKNARAIIAKAEGKLVTGVDPRG